METNRFRSRAASDDIPSIVLLVLLCLFLAAGLFLGWLWLMR